MIRINLLPHCAAKRALRKREFNLILIGTVIGVAALWYVGKLYLDERIASAAPQRSAGCREQEAHRADRRNQKLKDQTARCWPASRSSDPCRSTEAHR